jgi:hypothetical protein
VEPGAACGWHVEGGACACAGVGAGARRAEGGCVELVVGADWDGGGEAPKILANRASL